MTNDPSVREIPLARGVVALVDSEDFERIAAWRWRTTPLGYAITYIRTKTGRTTTSMHRLVLNAPKGTEVDHVNGDRLDNRRSNLRLLSRSENCQNRRGAQRGSKTGVRNVYFNPEERRYYVQVTAYGKRHCVGSFRNLSEASEAAASARRRLHPTSPDARQ